MWPSVVWVRNVEPVTDIFTLETRRPVVWILLGHTYPFFVGPNLSISPFSESNVEASIFKAQSDGTYIPFWTDASGTVCQAYTYPRDAYFYEDVSDHDS